MFTLTTSLHVFQGENTIISSINTYIIFIRQQFLIMSSIPPPISTNVSILSIHTDILMIHNDADLVNIAQNLGFFDLIKLPNASNSINYIFFFKIMFYFFYHFISYMCFMHFGQKQIVNTKFLLQNDNIISPS